MDVAEGPECPPAAFPAAPNADATTRITGEMLVIAAISADCIATGAPLATWRRRVMAAVGGISTRLPVLRSGRRPKFFADVAVRDRLVELHREVTIEAAVADCRQRFGAARTPSASAIQRFWSYLDKLGEIARRP